MRGVITEDPGYEVQNDNDWDNEVFTPLHLNHAHPKKKKFFADNLHHNSQISLIGSDTMKQKANSYS